MRFVPLLLLITALGCDTTPLAEAGRAAPELTWPEPAADVADAIDFRWKGAPVAQEYRFQVATDAQFQTMVIDSALVFSPRLVARNLTVGTTYFWRVAACIPDAEDIWSAARRFRVIRHLEPPGKPTLRYPANLQKNLPLETSVIWEPTPEATTYQLQVTLDSRLLIKEVDLEHLESTEFAIRGLVLTYPYWWRVRAWNPAGYGPWSNTWTFQVIF